MERGRADRPDLKFLVTAGKSLVEASLFEMSRVRWVELTLTGETAGIDLDYSK